MSTQTWRQLSRSEIVAKGLPIEVTDSGSVISYQVAPGLRIRKADFSSVVIEELKKNTVIKFQLKLKTEAGDFIDASIHNAKQDAEQAAEALGFSYSEYKVSEIEVEAPADKSEENPF